MRVIGIASGKGGTGKTTTAINLACALTNFGHDVVIVDANLTTPHVGVRLGSPVLPNTLNKVLKGEVAVKDAAYLHPCGIKVIPSSIHLNDTKDIETKKLKEVLVDLAKTENMVIMDLGSGSTKETTEAMRVCDELILVVNPDVTSMADALRAKHLAEQFGTKILGIIVNKQTRATGELTEKNVSHMLQLPIMGSVPQDDHVVKALGMYQPVVYAYPEAAVSIGLKKVAATLVGASYAAEVKKPKMQDPDIVDRVLDKLKMVQEKIVKKRAEK